MKQRAGRKEKPEEEKKGGEIVGTGSKTGRPVYSTPSIASLASGQRESKNNEFLRNKSWGKNFPYRPYGWDSPTSGSYINKGGGAGAKKEGNNLRQKFLLRERNRSPQEISSK